MRSPECKFRNLVVFFLLISGLRASAQLPVPEAGAGIIREKPGFDTSAVSRLFDASKELMQNPDSAIVLLEEALEISGRYGYAKGQANALLGIGTHYFNKGDLENSRRYFRRAYPYCAATAGTDNRALISYSNNMASVYVQQGHFDTATYFYLQALMYFNRTEPAARDSGLYTVLLTNLAVIWQHRGAYRQALYYSEKSLRIALQRNDSDRIADTWQNIGLIYNSRGDTAGALKMLLAALDMHLKRNRRGAAQIDYCGLARNTADPSAAVDYYEKALALGTDPGLALHKIYAGLGSSYLDLQNYNKAAYYLDLSRVLAEKQHFGEDLTAIYSRLADVYEVQRDFEKAHAFRKAYAGLRDSLNLRERTRFSLTLEAQYRTAEKDREISASRLELVSRELSLRKRNYQVAGAGLLLVLMGVLLSGFFLRTRRRQRLTAAKLHSLEQDQVIANLRSVMSGEEKERTRIARELHDGIMIQLAVIKMQLRRQVSRQKADIASVTEVLGQLEQTSTELRRTAHNLMPEMLIDAGFTDALDYYCRKLRKETELDIIFQHYGVVPHLQPETELYLFRIVQELLQNIIKHARAERALVQINYHKPLLTISVEDNGTGFDKELTEEGMGLKSIYGRLRVLQGTIDIRSGPKGTAVFIELNTEASLQKT